MIQLPTETQTDWSGGCNNRLKPTQLGANQYADGKNIEIRTGYPTTRRGSVLVYEWVDEYDLQGAHLYRAPYKAQRPETIILVRNGTVYRQNVPQAPVEMTLPAGVTISANESIRFVQAFSYLYMLRGEGADVLRWSGWPADAWELLTEPVAGDKMPNSGLGTYAYNRGWLVTNEDTLSASDILDEAFDLSTNSYELDQGEGGDITGVIPYLEGGLCVIKEGAVHILTGCNGDLTGLADTVIDSTHGGISPDALTQVGSDVWFLARDGVRSVTVTEQSKAQMLDVTLSRDIPEYVKRINWRYANKAQAVVFDNYYLLAVPWDDASVNDTVLVYDLELKAWVGYWQGWEVQRMFVGRLRGNQVLYALNNNGDLSVLLHGKYLDNAYNMSRYLDIKTSVDRAGVQATGITGLADANMVVTFGWYPIAANLTANYHTVLFVYGWLSTGTFSGVFVVSATATTVYVALESKIGTYKYWEALFPWSDVGGTDQWLSFKITHNGSTPTIQVNGETISPTISGDIDAWFGNFNSTVSILDVGFFSETSPKGVDGCHMRHVHLYTDTGSVVSDVVFFPLSQENGFVAHEAVADVDWPLVNASFGHSISIDYISTSLTSRAFSMGELRSRKTWLTGHATVAHRGPSWGVTLTGDTAYDTVTALTAKTYDGEFYGVHGVPDYDGTSARFADPHRENYAPVKLSDEYSYGETMTDEAGATMTDEAGNTMYRDVRGVQEGIPLDKEQEHTEHFGIGLVAPWVQATITNTQGTLALKELTLEAKPMRHGLKDLKE